MSDFISRKEFFELTRNLIGLPVSHVWRGFGTAVFLELGKLETDDTNNQIGEATFMLESDWRVEKQRSIYFGSGSGNRKIANGLQKLLNKKILNVEIEGNLPESLITFSDSLWLRTFAVYETQPQWTIFLPNRKCLSPQAGKISIERCDKD